jgi:hypothetical protein
MSSGFMMQDLPVSHFCWKRNEALTFDQEILLVDTKQDVNQYKTQCCKLDTSSIDEGCCGSSCTIKDLGSKSAPPLGDYDFNDWIGTSINLVDVGTSIDRELCRSFIPNICCENMKKAEFGGANGRDKYFVG